MRPSFTIGGESGVVAVFVGAFASVFPRSGGRCRVDRRRALGWKPEASAPVGQGASSARAKNPCGLYMALRREYRQRGHRASQASHRVRHRAWKTCLHGVYLTICRCMLRRQMLHSSSDS